MNPIEPQLRISLLGDCALLLDGAGKVFDQPVQEKIWATAEEIAGVAGVEEAVPGMNNLMIVYDPDRTDPETLEKRLRDIWAAGAEARAPGTIIDVPTVYGGPQGEDLDELAAAKGLPREEIVRLHTSAIYTVAAVGAMPGFVYLSGLDPLLATPRRRAPRAKVSSGSVILGGAQAGIMPVTAPSGWHILGHTKLVLFDASRKQPATFKPGDRIRFVVEGLLP